MTDKLADAGNDPIKGEQQEESDKSSEAPKGLEVAFKEALQEVEKTEKTKSDTKKEKTIPDKKVSDPDDNTPKEKQTKENKQESSETKEEPSETKDELKAPQRWPKEWKDNFSKLPPEGQKLMIDQHKAWERGYNGKFEELANARKQLESSIPPQIRKKLEDNGVTSEQAISRLTNLWERAEANPTQFIAEFMAKKRIDPNIFVSPNASTENNQQVPPTVQQQLASIIQPMIQPVFEEVAHLRQGHDAFAEQQAMERDKAIKDTLTEAWTSDEFPYLEQVEDTMADILESNPNRFAHLSPRQRLEEAYKIAVHTVPWIREEIVSAEVQSRAMALEQENLSSGLSLAATAKPKTSGHAARQAPKGLRAAFDEALKEVNR